MGATKRVAELIVTGFNKRSQSTYCAVRFGNVLGSRGSVIPVFERQIWKWSITVTNYHDRYFMNHSEAKFWLFHAGVCRWEVFIIWLLAKKMVASSGPPKGEI